MAWCCPLVKLNVCFTTVALAKIRVKFLETSLPVFVVYLTGRGYLLLFTVEEIHLIVTESLIKIYALLTETL